MDDSEEKDRNSDLFAPGYLLAGRYEIERVLGTGGMGAVYLARDRILASELVAVKVLHKQLAFEKKYTQRFLREVQLMRKVNHHNVVRTFDVGAEGDTVYLTMEYAPGRSLLNLMENRLLALEDLPDVAIQISRGLQAIHDAGIIHRDLKPENVIITNEGIAKITDFGVARPELSQLTAHDEIIGSAAYMAPEVWRGEPLTSSVDIYALGVILYEAATGKLPFDAESPAALMGKHLDEAPIPPKSNNRAIPQWLNRLILRLLAKKPSDRPRTAIEIIDVISAETARISRRKKIDTEPTGHSVEESTSHLSKLEQRSKRVADPKATVATTIERPETATRRKGGSSSFRMAPPSRTSAILRPLRVGNNQLRSLLQAFITTCDGLPYFLTYSIAILGTVAALNFVSFPQSADAAPGSSVMDLLETNSLRGVILIITLSLPVALLSTFSGNIAFILRIAGCSIAAQGLLSFGLTIHELLPVLDQGRLDGRAINVAATAASTTLSEISFLSATATTFSHTVLAQGLALHSPERKMIWESFQLAIPALLYLVFVGYCFYASSRHTNRAPFVTTCIGLIWILGLLVLPAIHSTLAAWLGSPIVFSDSLFAQRLTGGIEIYWSSLITWLGVYFIIGVIGPVISGPSERD